MTPKDEMLFGRLAGEILAATGRLAEGQCREDELPSASDLARTLNVKLELVKKKLRVLKEQSLIHPVSLSPKRYRFDTWALRELDENNPLYEVLRTPESAYFLEI